MRKIKIVLLALVILVLGSNAGCTSNKKLTGKEYIKKEQKYNNYEAWKKRNKGRYKNLKNN
jgi:sortase (surface protein transpeptidase)